MKWAIGIDLGGTNSRAALVNEEGQIKASLREATPAKEGPEAVVGVLAKMVNQLKQHCVAQELLGIGIGSPGPLDRHQKKIIKTPNLPGFDNFPLGVELEKHTDLKSFLDNDAKCATYGEARFGCARGVKNLVLLTFGTGIGAGVLVDGKMMYGKSDGACEIGHLTLYPDGHPCPCGNRGCFEQYCSASALKRRAAAMLGSQLGGKEIFQMAQEGHPQMSRLIDEVAKDLAIALASLTNIFEPEMIVLAGGLFTEGGEPLLSRARNGMRGRCFASSLENLEVCASTLGGDAGVLGAASLVF